MNPVAATGSRMLTETFTIGELARIADTKVETIRYYERIGLLPPPPRTRGNYRAYTRSHFERLSFIRRGRELGFSLDAVRDLLRLSDDRKRSCAEIDELARAHLADVDNKLVDMVELRRVLHQLIDQCQHGTVADCRIIQALAPRA
jgi:Cu(I)-responsive transcriptional regulator